MNTESLDIKNLPSPIQTLISGKSYETDSMGKSGAGVFVFEDFVLKILDVHDKQIRKQNDLSVQVMRWLQGKLPVPKVICYESDDDFQYLVIHAAGEVKASRLTPVEPHSGFSSLQAADP